MIGSTRRFNTIVSLTLGLAAALSVSGSASAQSGDDSSYIAVVKGNDVYVRCGAAESYYPFAKLNDGDLVKVTGEKYDWVRVVAIGPAFKSSFGYIKYAKDDTSRFRLSPDGHSGTTLGKIDIIAPNLDAKSSPKDSWKSIMRLDADQTLRVMKAEQTDKDMILTVALPETSQGWINKAYQDRASAEQMTQWTAMLKNSDATAKATAKSTPSTAMPEKTKTARTNDSKGASASGTSPTTPTQASTVTPTGDVEMGDATSPSNAPSEAPKRISPPERKQPSLDDLEAAYKILQREPAETAEVNPLRNLYLELAKRSAGDERVVRYATGRADQLQIWADLQKKRAELNAIRNRTTASAKETAAVQEAMERGTQYTAVGLVAASTIYDGKRLPKLLRLQDASTGRTIAYLQPDEKNDVIKLVSNLVGIVGEKTFDESLRLNIITPTRMDVLTPEGMRQASSATPKSDSDSTPEKPAAADQPKHVAVDPEK